MRRALFIGVIAAALLAVVLSAMPGPATAELRSVLVKLVSGEVVAVTVDVDPGAPLESQPVPGMPGAQIIGYAPEPEPPAAGGEPDGGGATPPPDEPAKEQPPPDPTDRARDKVDDEKGTAPGRKKPRPKVEAKPKGGPKVKPKARRDRSPAKAPAGRRPDGTPTKQNPTYAESNPGARVQGVANFTLREFEIPPFLLPIYQAAGMEYGVQWEVLAAINSVETAFGRNLNVSSAGALGWMQFMPATWRMYGVDANKDGSKDPYNPVDAIFAAARYLKASGAGEDIRRAVYAYNHAWWYVDMVMVRARLYAGMPPDFVGSLTGLADGRFPVHAKARYADDLSEREATREVGAGQNAANLVEGSAERRDIEIYTKLGAPVVATNDAVVKRIGRDRSGRYIVIQDVYGNRYRYGGLRSVARVYPVPKDDNEDGPRTAKALSAKDPKPTAPASAGRQPTGTDSTLPAPRAAQAVATKQRLFAHPRRPNAYQAGGADQLLEAAMTWDGFTTFRAFFSRPFGLDKDEVEFRRLRKGSRVIGGTIIGRVGRPEATQAPHLVFEIRPAGKGAPAIDPKPILDGWRLLEATAIYRANGKNALRGDDNVSLGQVLLMSKPLLERRVLNDERIEIYPCGRTDIRSGEIDRRVLATIAFLAESGMRPTITSLKCGHSFYTKSGNVSHHSSGNAVDIARLNGIPLLGHQGRGSVGEHGVKRLMNLQGTMRPDQIISLLDFGANTVAMGDHADHIHVGFRPLFGSNRRLGAQVLAILQPSQWETLIDRLAKIGNPNVPRRPSKYSLPAGKRRASHAHHGE